MKTTLPVAIAAILVTTAAHADVFLGLADPHFSGGATVQVASGVDSVEWSGSYGDPWKVNRLSLTDIGAKLDELAIDVRGTNRSELHIYATATGQLGQPANLLSEFQSIKLPVGWTEEMSTWIDFANGVFTEVTPLASAAFGATGSQSSMTAIAGAEPYSITAKIVLRNPPGGDTAESAIRVSAVPEPWSLGVLGSGLIGMSMILRRRRPRV